VEERSSKKTAGKRGRREWMNRGGLDSRSIGGLEQHGRTRAAGEDSRIRGGQEQQRRIGEAGQEVREGSSAVPNNLTGI
jgi:hypothetical protein